MTVACLVFACNSPKPGLTDADEDLGAGCVPYLDLLVAHTLASGEDGSELGMAALGAPDEATVAIDTNAILLAGFVGAGGVINEEGADLMAHGMGTEDVEVAVYVGPTPSDLAYSGAITPDSSDVDLATAAATHVIYAQFIGLAGRFDLDAVEAVQTTCTE